SAPLISCFVAGTVFGAFIAAEGAFLSFGWRGRHHGSDGCQHGQICLPLPVELSQFSSPEPRLTGFTRRSNVVHTEPIPSSRWRKLAALFVASGTTMTAPQTATALTFPRG